jgi:hypothetical protein
MNLQRRSGLIVSGWVSLVLVAGTAGAQMGAGGGERNYAGSSGSQILQEQMYADRMKEILGEQSQGQGQGMGGQQGMKGSQESSQKMQREEGAGSSMERSKGGDKTMGEKSKGNQ